jgi:hypothetical protein
MSKEETFRNQDDEKKNEHLLCAASLNGIFVEVSP